jgi:hypothetical protein
LDTVAAGVAVFCRRADRVTGDVSATGSGVGTVIKASGSTGCGLGKATLVCGIESGAGGGAGAGAASGLGAAGTAAAILGVRRHTQPASDIAMQAARSAWAAWVWALRFISGAFT